MGIDFLHMSLLQLIIRLAAKLIWVIIKLLIKKHRR